LNAGGVGFGSTQNRAIITQAMLQYKSQYEVHSQNAIHNEFQFEWHRNVNAKMG
jgi:hypothetical protein